MPPVLCWWHRGLPPRILSPTVHEHPQSLAVLRKEGICLLTRWPAWHLCSVVLQLPPWGHIRGTPSGTGTEGAGSPPSLPPPPSSSKRFYITSLFLFIQILEVGAFRGEKRNPWLGFWKTKVIFLYIKFPYAQTSTSWYESPEGSTAQPLKCQETWEIRGIILQIYVTVKSHGIRISFSYHHCLLKKYTHTTNS